MHGTMGRMSGAAANVVSPYNQLTESLHKGKIGMNEMRMVMRDSEGVWANNERLIRSTGNVMYDATGNARVMVNRMGELNGATAGVGTRLRVFNTFLAESSSSLVKWGKNTQWAGRQLTVGFTVPLMLVGRHAASAAEEYDRAMTRVVKVTNFTAEEGTKALDMQMESVREQTRRLTEFGAELGFMAEETASTIGEFAQMGYQGSALDQLSDAALRLSRTTGSDLQTSIEATRIAAQAYGEDLDDLNETFARLNIVENNTALSVSESVLGLPVVGAVANAVGMDIQETNGLMAMMKNSGISAKEGATALRTGLLQLVQEATPNTISSFEKVGMSFDDMKDKMNEEGEGSPLHFFDQLADKKQELEGNQVAMNDFSAAMSKLFGVRQTSRILSFLDQFNEKGEEGTAGFKAWMGVNEEAQEVMRVYDFEMQQIQESAAGMAETLRAQLNVEMAELGQTFLEVANKARQFAVDFLSWFNNLNEGTKRVALSVAGLLAVLGPVIMLLGLFANAAGNLLNIFTKILPKWNMITTSQQAQSIAFHNTAAAIRTADTSLKNHIATIAAYRAAAAGGPQITTMMGTQVAGTASSMMAEGPAGRGVMNPANFGRNAINLTPAAPAAAAPTSQAVGAAAFGDLTKKVKDIGQKMTGSLANGARSFTGRLSRAFTHAGTLISRGLTSMAPKLMAGVQAGIAGMTGAMGKVGGGAAIGKGAGMAAGFGGAALKGGAAALLGPIGAVAAAIAAIPILADPAAFFAGFRQQFEPAFDRMRGIIDGIREAFGRVVEMFRQAAGDGDSGLSKVASILGKIAGWLGGAIVDALNFVLGFIEPIVNAFEFIFHLIDGIATLFTDGWSEAAPIFLEALKALGRMVMGVVTNMIRGVADLIDRIPIPGMGRIADAMRSGADSMDDWQALASDFTGELERGVVLAREFEDAEENIADAIKERADYEQEAIDAKAIGRDREYEDLEKIIREQTEAGEALSQSQKDQVDSSIERIMNEEHLTDEMAAQLIHRRNLVVMENQIASARAEIARIESENDFDEAGNRAAYEERERQYRLIEQAVDEIDNGHERAINTINGQTGAVGELEDGLGDVNDEIGEMNEGADELLNLLNTFVSNIRSEVANSMSNVANAVTEGFQMERDAAMEAFSDRMDNIKDEFAARGDALKERIDNEKESFKEAHEARMEQIQVRHENEMDRFEERRQKERDAIEDAADAKIEALEDEEKKEEDSERRRERAFEREKARINYLHGLRTGNISMQLALARGELSQAAIMREEIGHDTRQFHRDSASRERGYVMEDRKRARDEEIELIKDVTKARLDAFDEETEKQKEALETQQEQTIKALEEQNKAQEKALERRHKMMEDSLKREQDLAEQRIETEQEAAEAGFEARERAIQRTLEEWQRINPQTEDEYRDHLETLRGDLNDHAGINGGTWTRIVERYASNTGVEIGNGFQSGVTRAKQAMGEDARWEQFGEAMMTDLGNGVSSGLTDAFKEVAELFGVEMPEASGGNVNYPTSGPGWAQHSAVRAGRMHTGGTVTPDGRYEGLKPDEVPAVLQTGEYVVQRSAVQTVGSDLLERINNAHRMRRDDDHSRKPPEFFHDGGSVNWQKKVNSGSTPNSQGKTFGKFLSYLSDHGAMPGMGAMGSTGEFMSGLTDLIPPDKGSTWRFDDWRTGVNPRVVEIASAVLHAIPGGQTITSAYRPGATVAGSGRPSQHGAGMAVDVAAYARRDPRGNAQTEREGDAIAAAFRSHPNVGQVLWKTMTGGNHYNHVHAGFRFHEGGLLEDLPDFSDMDVGSDFGSEIIGTLMGGFFNKMAQGMAHGVPDSGMMGVPPDASGPIKKYAKNMLSNFGWSEGQWPALHELVQRESSWNPNGQNPNSTAYGLFQFLDSTWAGVNARKTSDPYQQISAGYQYIKNRYGNPQSALDFWQRRVPINGRDVGHWYHQGGQVSIPQLAAGGHVNYDNVVANLHKKETVLTSPLSQKLERGIDRMAAGDSFGDVNVNIDNFHGTEDNIDLLVAKIEQAQEKRAARKGVRRKIG